MNTQGHPPAHRGGQEGEDITQALSDLGLKRGFGIGSLAGRQRVGHGLAAPLGARGPTDGLGYLIAVPHKRIQGGIFLLGAFGLTYVEQIAVGMEHGAFWPMFVSVLVMNTGFALDAYQEVNALGDQQGG